MLGTSAHVRARRLALTAAMCSALAGLPISGCQLIVDFDRSRIGDAGPDGGDVDAGALDAGEIDAGEIDAGADAGEIDAGEIDAGEIDAGESDAGESDAGESDAGESDAGPADAGPADAGPPDAGSDAGPAMTCGNGTVEGTEACDDGNTITEGECMYGVASCMACNATCTAALTLTGPVCGDSAIEAGEEVCDDGNTVTETACPYGTPTCTRCDATCDAVLALTGPFCGDLTANGPEQCDGTDLDGETCTTVPGGFTGGTLGCTSGCMFDTSGCT